MYFCGPLVVLYVYNRWEYVVNIMGPQCTRGGRRVCVCHNVLVLCVTEVVIKEIVSESPPLFEVVSAVHRR